MLTIQMFVPPLRECPKHEPRQTYLIATCQEGLISETAQRCANCGQLDRIIEVPNVVSIEASKQVA